MLVVVGRFSDLGVDPDVAEDQGHEREEAGDEELLPDAREHDVLGRLHESEKKREGFVFHRNGQLVASSECTEQSLITHW